jgi:hypothetical protein
MVNVVILHNRDMVRSAALKVDTDLRKEEDLTREISIIHMAGDNTSATLVEEKIAEAVMSGV